MVRIFTRLVAVFIIISILTACYKASQSQYTSSTISYQFEEPHDYCQRRMSDNGVNMQCDEGRINIKFESVDTISPADFIAQEYEINDDYNWEQIEGKHSKITLAIRSSSVLSDEIMTPTYIAVFPISKSLLVIAEGFPVNGMENNFDTIFKSLIASFEPYS